MLLKVILSGLMISAIGWADPIMQARASIMGKVKTKNKTIADAQFKQGKKDLNLVFDSEHLKPGSYQLEVKLDCQKKSKGWIIGEFKTESGFISTEFVHTLDKTKINVFSLEQPSYLAVIKKGKKEQVLSCTEIKVQELPAQAVSTDIFN
jgi:hypothetical protein